MRIPDEVIDGLARLAAGGGLSVAAFATRHLAVIARRADNAALLADLPDLNADPAGIVEDVRRGRGEP